MRRTSLVVLVLGVLLLTACSSDEVVSTGGQSGPGTTTPPTPSAPIPDGAAGLDQARARWTAAGIEDYSMSYRVICFCPNSVTSVEVHGGEVVNSVTPPFVIE